MTRHMPAPITPAVAIDVTDPLGAAIQPGRKHCDRPRADTTGETIALHSRQEAERWISARVADWRRGNPTIAVQ